MKSVGPWLVLAAALMGCVQEEPITSGPRPPKDLPQPFIFEFHTVAVQIDGQSRAVYEDGHMTCTDLNALKICSNVSEEFISFELTNHSAEPVSVLWSAARWVDEFGRPHPLARFPGDKYARDHVVQAGDIQRLSPFPSEKTYLVPDPEYAYYFTEPIIPWDLRSGDPDEKRRVMMENRRSTFLTVPIAIAGEEHVVAFEFQVFPRQKSEVPAKWRAASRRPARPNEVRGCGS